jgi:transcription elongation factor GreB
MSKAFTKESDDAGDDAPPIFRPQLPPGITNLITAHGAQRLRQELAELRGWKSRLASETAERNESSPAELRKLQGRIRQLEQVLQAVVVAEPPADRGRVGFGACVLVRHSNNEDIRYHIVGVDESDPAKDEISWLSPLARQLMGHRTGDCFRFRSPAGEEELEIMRVSYD